MRFTPATVAYVAALALRDPQKRIVVICPNAREAEAFTRAVGEYLRRWEETLATPTPQSQRSSPTAEGAK